jgi:hypothetical protein
MPALTPFIFQQFFDDNGDPLAAGTITFYAAGTSTPLDAYGDQAGDTVSANPLTLDSAGRATIFLGPDPYDIVLKNSSGSVIDTIEGVSTTGGGGGASLQTTSTLSTLRGLASGSSDYVLLGGNTAVGDAGSYFYYWSGTSSASDDGVNVVRPSSNPATGRWLRLYQNKDSEGSFTATLTGVTTAGSTSGTAYYSRKGRTVTIRLPNLYGTSTSTSMTVTGLPAALLPTTNIGGISIPTVRDNNLYYSGVASINSDSISFEFKATATGDFTAIFTAANTKGIYGGSNPDGIQITYTLIA